MAAKEISGDSLASNLAGMSKTQLYEIMSQMKALIEQNQEQARQILVQNPLLTRALFQAQIMLGMVQAPRTIPNILPQAAQQPQQSTQTVQSASLTMAPALPSQVGLHEQTNVSLSQIPLNKPLQNQSTQGFPPAPVPQLTPSQSIQLPRGDLSSQTTIMPLPQQSFPAPNMSSMLLHSGPQSSVHQPPLPPMSAHLQRPLQSATSNVGHIPLQVPMAPQSRPQMGPSHQLQSQMGPSVNFQHPNMPQSHHSQPSYHSGMKPPGPTGPSFLQGQQPLPSQLPPQSLYQGGGAHLGPDFNMQSAVSMQVERGQSWAPGLPEISNSSQLPAPPQFGRPPAGVSNQPPHPPPLTPEMEQALLQQVMSLTQEQINLLPPEQRNQVLQLQQMLRQ
ncbi:hypothetical protein Droror1_Dr00007261 [Drosera rotundifolia]